MKKLIVNADDLGLAKSINEGIARACREGIVTFISPIPSGEAFDDAARLAAELKLEEIGAHLALSETVPVTDPARIPTLVTKEGRFYPHHNEFLLKFFLGMVKRDEIYLELKNQLERLRKLNIRITNISSHEHVHMVPEILKIFVRLAKEYDIPSIRYPRGEGGPVPLAPAKFYRSIVLSCFEKRMGDIARKSGLAYTGHFRGFLDSGDLNEGALIGIIGGLQDGTTELVCHPGFLGPEVVDRYRWHINCETELFALTSPRVRKALDNKSVKLISYKDLLLERGA
ncbi:MAG: ChbG/HpnK family deacetylase [Candidatus Omnitrophica bacterium]|nr:ChbG/HpnK family deacetylase [Candidatus Omnitrophota bacterium]